MGNLSILDHNILHALQGLACADEAERVYLAKRDRLPPLASERSALCWAGACTVIEPSVRLAEAQFDGVDHGALDFIRTRFLNMGDA